MALLTPTETSLCNKLVSDYDSLVSPVKNAKSFIRSQKSQLDTYVRGMTFSDDGVINNAISDFESQVDDSLPGSDIGSMNDLKSFLDNCGYLGALAPMSAVLGTMTGVYDNITNLVKTISVPEFGAGGLLSALNKLLAGAEMPGGDMLSALLAKADILLACLAGLCGSGYNSDVVRLSGDLNQLYSDTNIVGNPLSSNYGKFDADKVFNDAGISLAQKEKINRVTSSVDGAKSNAKTKIEDSIKKVKALEKLGDFF